MTASLIASVFPWLLIADGAWLGYQLIRQNGRILLRLEGLRSLPVLAGVRNPAALADLPEPERQALQLIWQEVEELLQRSNPAR